MTTKVLLIEDDRELSLAMSMLLRGKGYDVASAGDGATALTAIRKADPDVVLLDLGLPGGDGLDVLTRMRGLESTVSIPVIVLTARDESYRDICIRSGAQAFFRKPADQQQLLGTIDQLVSGGELALPPTMERAEALAMLHELFRTAPPAPVDEDHDELDDAPV